MNILVARHAVFTLCSVAVCAIGAEKSTTRESAIPLQDWAKQAMKDLDRTETAIDSVGRLRQHLHDSGMPEREDAQFLTWLQSVDKHTQEKYQELLSREQNIREDLLEIWSEIGDPTPIVKTKPEELHTRATSIVSGYREILRQKGTHGRERVVGAALPLLIEAIDSPYTVPAIHILQQWVEFDHELVVPHWKTIPGAPVVNREQMAKQMRRWYRRIRDKLAWNDVKGRFQEGAAFESPGFELVFKEVVAE